MAFSGFIDRTAEETTGNRIGGGDTQQRAPGRESIPGPPIPDQWKTARISHDPDPADRIRTSITVNCFNYKWHKWTYVTWLHHRTELNSELRPTHTAQTSNCLIPPLSDRSVASRLTRSAEKLNTSLGRAACCTAACTFCTRCNKQVALVLWVVNEAYAHNFTFHQNKT